MKKTQKQLSKEVKDRFEVTVGGGLLQSISIVTDRSTGVQYLAVPNSGLSVIVDKDGKPLLTEIVEEPNSEKDMSIF